MNTIETGAYDRRTVWLHWLVALLVIGLWIAGQCINFMPRGTPKIMFRSTHIAVGVVLALFWMSLRRGCTCWPLVGITGNSKMA